MLENQLLFQLSRIKMYNTTRKYPEYIVKCFTASNKGKHDHGKNNCGSSTMEKWRSTSDEVDNDAQGRIQKTWLRGEGNGVETVFARPQKKNDFFHLKWSVWCLVSGIYVSAY